MKIAIDGSEVTLSEVYSGVGIQTDMGLFGIAQRDGGIEVMLDGKTVWTSHEIEVTDLVLNSRALREAQPRQRHWFYADGPNDPPAPLSGFSDDLRRDELDHIRAAARFAVRASTVCDTVDPDAMVKNMVIGVLGRSNTDGGGEPFTTCTVQCVCGWSGVRADLRVGGGCPVCGSGRVQRSDSGELIRIGRRGIPKGSIASEKAAVTRLEERYKVTGVVSDGDGWRLEFDHPVPGKWTYAPKSGNAIEPKVGEEMVFGAVDEHCLIRSLTVGGRLYVTAR